MDKLHVKHADTYPKVSQTIPEIIDMISVLIDKGYAYELNGDVYFSVEKFKGYGKLSGRKLEDMMLALALKSMKANTILWILLFGKQQNQVNHSGKAHGGNGRPGWHIEMFYYVFKISW